MRCLLRCGTLLVGCQMAAQPALAHHAASGLYDRSTTVAVSGTIDSVFWRNPHVRLSLAVAGADGATEMWEVETGSVNTLERMGVTADRFNVGDRIDVSGYAGRGGRKIMFAQEMVAANGESLPLGGGGGGDITQRYARPEQVAAGRALDSGPAADIFRVWVPTVLPNTGAGRTTFPLTAAALAARASWDPAQDPVLRCIPPGMPAAMDNPYPIAFDRRGDDIVVRLEEWDGVRTIHMGAASGAAPTAPSPMGYSVGRFEGNTLVVDTDRIDYPYFDDLGTPQSRDIRVRERFTLLAAERRLTWDAEIVDPKNFTATVVMKIEWQWIPGHEIKPFDCALPTAD
jgi:Family of unknown function (DUF6152)